MSFNTPSNPFVLNSHGDEAFVFGAIGNHLVQSNSILISSNHTNHDVSGHGDQYGNMLNSRKQEPGMVLPSRYFPSSSSSFSSSFMCSRNSIPIPYFGPSNQFELGKRMVPEMRRNLISTSPPRTRVSSSIDYFPIEDNPHLTRVSITETVTKQLSAVIPTNNIVSVQNDMERVKRALVCESNIWNSPARHASLFQNVHGRTKRTEILRAKPLSIVSPQVHNRNPYTWHRGKNKIDSLFPRSHKDPVYPGSLNISPSPNHRGIPNNGYQEYHLQANQGKRSREYKKDGDMVEYFFNYSEEDEDNGYDGRTHSLPYEKYGPYTCPKCNNVSDTSQKFAAHMVSVHYKNETSEEKRKRLRARYKKRFRMLQPEMVGVKLDISEHLGARKELENIDSEVKKEEGTEKEDGGSSNGEGTLYNVVVKQELM